MLVLIALQELETKKRKEHTTLPDEVRAESSPTSSQGSPVCCRLAQRRRISPSGRSRFGSPTAKQVGLMFLLSASSPSEIREELAPQK